MIPERVDEEYFQKWYQMVGGRTEWLKYPAIEDLGPEHLKISKLNELRRIVIHHSGFTAGNASLFRWYHQRANGWPDVGYHYIIGNGRGGYSTKGGVENGRPEHLQGAHAKGNNQDSLGICLIDNPNHFKTTQPSDVELLALENLLFFLFSFSGGPLEILRHSQLNGTGCPGPMVPVEKLAARVQQRWNSSLHHKTVDRTLDLRRLFRDGTVDWKKPSKEISRFKARGITRLVLPYHWRDSPWEDKAILREWTTVAHDNRIPVFMYTGPFGTETRRGVASNPEWSEWFQTGADGVAVTYGGLAMFCPRSPYLRTYRLPIIMDALAEVPFDGVFFDIPWMMKGACHCSACTAVIDQGSNINDLSLNEKAVREAMAEAVLTMRRDFPCLWVGANVGAPGVWEVKDKGASPRALTGLFDELIVEFSRQQGMDNIAKVITAFLNTMYEAPGCRISHAHLPGMGVGRDNIKEIFRSDLEIGEWCSGLE
jgi:hypothetical protein